MKRGRLTLHPPQSAEKLKEFSLPMNFPLILIALFRKMMDK